MPTLPFRAAPALLSAAALLAANAAAAFINGPKADLDAAYGAPLKSFQFKKDPLRDECAVYKATVVGKSILVVAYIKDGKVCWLGYGRLKKFDEITEAERLFILQDNCGGSKWKADYVTEIGKVSYKREDGEAFAFYFYKDVQRPFINILSKWLKEAIERRATEKSPEEWVSPMGDEFE